MLHLPIILALNFRTKHFTLATKAYTFLREVEKNGEVAPELCPDDISVYGEDELEAMEEKKGVVRLDADSTIASNFIKSNNNFPDYLVPLFEAVETEWHPDMQWKNDKETR